MTLPQSLALHGVGKRFGAATAVADASLEVPAGSYVVLLGPSGSGKTTLLSIIGGFTAPSEGRILIGGADVTAMPPAQRPTATVFQDYALFPHLSVAGNVGFGLAVRGVRKAERRLRAEAALDLVGLAGFGDRMIAALSGGQRQRVALARSLVVEPAILLLDEPLGALDLHLRRQMQDELKALQLATGRSFVHVTHDQEEAMALADIVVVMNRGRIEDAGPPARVYARPATRFAAGFMGESTLIEGTVRGRDGERLAVTTADGEFRLAADAHTGAAGAAVAVAIRPERLRLAPRPGDVTVATATVSETVFQGGFVRVKARSEAGTLLLAKVPPEEAPAAGARITLFAAAGDLVLIPGDPA
ncbi:ABC transporter ATP-binding protein [Methylobrevis albus]|uniref:ABC transporter ATP-binding protein n=1 Tax=Methylobrevis albus TaxID=2793297 RepID=A0A931I0W0_9HYPH|nr:ABC transporter ATP-binding protein [Methylobrevis albus]MBH0237314.1 ABC transporter ATP-binding protein [Methylobrevis albus]